MSGTSVAAEREASMNGANRLKERAALASIAVSALMTAAKFAAGLASGSLAILSEAGHNLADVAPSPISRYGSGTSPPTRSINSAMPR
jgi:divalent metal cation (Fe/Co/Zn/Cd) transporter